MTTPDYVRAHKHSMHNREEILSSDRCGCFYCGEMFPPTEVEDWTDEREDIGQTALCPRCGIDAVIGSKSGYPITIDFLGLMRTHWFQIAQDKTNQTNQTNERNQIDQKR